MAFTIVYVYTCDGCGLEYSAEIRMVNQGMPAKPEGWEEVTATNPRTHENATLVYCAGCYGTSDFGRAIGATNAEGVGTRPGNNDGPGDDPDGGVREPV